MKKITAALSTILLYAFISCTPSTNEVQNTSKADDTYKKLYEKSIAMRDYNTAIMAIQQILLTDSTNGLRDSLPELFAAASNLEACMTTTQESMKRYPDNEKFQALMLLCYQQIGDFESQFALLNDLYVKTKKPQYLVQIATIQLQSGNIREAMKTIDGMMAEFKNSKEKIEVVKDETSKQMVPIMAALWNMKGYAYMQQKNIDKAKDAYFKALEIDPNFQMPQRNLNMIFDNKMR
jgi:tetratricopeptide (TPR) repeat protein